jgi:hypothetical protein
VAGGEGEGEGMETIKRNTKGSLLEESWTRNLRVYKFQKRKIEAIFHCDVLNCCFIGWAKGKAWGGEKALKFCLKLLYSLGRVQEIVKCVGSYGLFGIWFDWNWRRNMKFLPAVLNFELNFHIEKQALDQQKTLESYDSFG